MTLHFYFARRFLSWLTVIFLGLSALIVLIDIVDQTTRFVDRGASAAGIFELVVLNAPQAISQILPLIVLLATVAFFINLARTSELVATRAAGRSALGALVAPVVVVLILGTLATTTLNPIVAATSTRYNEVTQTYRTAGAASFSISSEGLWLRQATEDGQMLIRAWRSNADGSVLYDVAFLAYEEPGNPKQRIRADSAQLKDGTWILRNAKDWPLGRGVNAESNAIVSETLTIPSTLTLENIRESFGQPSSISIWKLPDHIAQLKRAGYSSLEHQVWMQSELARPLFLVAMVLIAGAFTMRHTRFGGTGTAVLAAVMLGFALYFVRNFSLILGENGQIAVYLAAWAPPVASVLLAFGPILHAEDG